MRTLRSWVGILRGPQSSGGEGLAFSSSLRSSSALSELISPGSNASISDWGVIVASGMGWGGV